MAESVRSVTMHSPRQRVQIGAVRSSLFCAVTADRAGIAMVAPGLCTAAVTGRARGCQGLVVADRSGNDDSGDAVPAQRHSDSLELRQKALKATATA